MRNAGVLVMVLTLVLAGCGTGVRVAREEAPKGAAGPLAWEVTTLAGPGGVGIGRNSLAVDASGVVHVAYRAGTSLHYGVLRDGKWQSERVEAGSLLGCCRTTGLAADLALGADGLAVITYGTCGCLAGKGVRRARKTADGEWQCETIAKRGNLGRYTAVATDGTGRTHVTYLDYKKQDDLYYAVSKEEGWEIRAVDVEPNAGFFCDLAVDAAGKVHVVYATVWGGYEGIDYTSDDYVPDDLKYATFHGERWRFDTIDTYGDVGYWPCVRLEGSGAPHVSWAGEHRIKYAVHRNGAWTLRVADQGDDVGNYTSLALDENMQPWVVYDRGRRLWIAHWNGSDWKRQLVDGTGEVGANCAVDIGPDGAVHVVYSDRTHKDLKYARLKR